MTKDRLCTSPKDCKRKSFKLVGTTHVYICMSDGWCQYRRKDGQESYHQHIKHMEKWARKGER